MKRFTYKGKSFYLDGEAFTIRSGAIHYFRIPSAYWRDRLLKLKECGFNCVETYVVWNLHESQEGEFNFSGGLNLGRFIDEAKALGLYVIVRPGPYICAEWEFGGLPAWLLSYPQLRIRCNNALYLEKLYRYLNRVFEVVKPRLIEAGGNVLMMQVENEYGGYGRDKGYLSALYEFYKSRLPNCIFFTSDSIDDVDDFEAGAIEGCLSFVNFGSETLRRMEKLESLRPNQPLMCMEFWSGWFDHWHGEHHVRSAADICESLTPFFEHGYNFNMYMFCGGTNFGFMNGAVLFPENEGGFQATVTSYDYSAPLNEAGDRTESYYLIRNLFEKYVGNVPALTATDSEKRAYGQVHFSGRADLLENAEKIGKVYNSSTPLSMEECKQAYGYTLYVADEFSCREKGRRLLVNGVKDRALVFLDGERVKILERTTEAIALPAKENIRLSILAENMGRINFGPNMFEKKGIDGATVAYVSGRVLHGWKNISLPMQNLDDLLYGELKAADTPAFFRASFFVDEKKDTFLKPSGFGKGFALINGINVGRFYNDAGPQKTLYVPKSFLKDGENELIIFNSDGLREIYAEFVAAPSL